MKKIASNLKLELAMYREVLGFAQFGDDLDDETRYLLQRGKTLVQILKQPQYRPMSIKKQIILLNSGIKGYFVFYIK